MKTCPGLPLVMHGSSAVPQEFIDLVNKYGGAMPNAKGVPEDQIAMAVQKYGVCKVNIDTDLRLAMTAKIREVFATKPAEFDPRNYLGPAARRSPDGAAQAARAEQRRQGDAINKHWEKLGKPLPAEKRVQLPRGTWTGNITSVPLYDRDGNSYPGCNLAIADAAAGKSNSAVRDYILVDSGLWLIPREKIGVEGQEVMVAGEMWTHEARASSGASVSRGPGKSGSIIRVEQVKRK
jgi:uncharacterized protein YjhX (UPF0386 family)